MVGILEVDVRQIVPTRPYNRKRGGQGTVARVVLGDATGEIDLVLWDEETNQVAGGPFQPGATLRLAGATVKAGFRGGLELGLGLARVTPGVPRPPEGLSGVLESVGETRVVGAPPEVAFQADIAVRCTDGLQHIVVSGQALLDVRALAPGAHMEISHLRVNPALENWWRTTAESRCTATPDPRNP